MRPASSGSLRDDHVGIASRGSERIEARHRRRRHRLQCTQTLPERTQIAHAREVVRRPQTAIEVVGDQAEMTGVRVHHLRRDAGVGRRGVQRQFAGAIETRIRASRFR